MQKSSRRQVLKAIAATTGAVGMAALPEVWEKPVVDVGALPASAQVSPAPTATATNVPPAPTGTATNVPPSATRTPTATNTPTPTATTVVPSVVHITLGTAPTDIAVDYQTNNRAYVSSRDGNTVYIIDTGTNTHLSPHNNTQPTAVVADPTNGRWYYLFADGLGLVDPNEGWDDVGVYAMNSLAIDSSNDRVCVPRQVSVWCGT